jgi:hypothetical protein
VFTISASGIHKVCPLFPPPISAVSAKIKAKNILIPPPQALDADRR